MIERTLCWFRADLRVQDNPALHAAALRGEVVGAFVITPEQWALHDWAGVKVEFILRTLAVLSESLGRLNIPLKVLHARTFDQAPGVLLSAAKQHGCGGLEFNAEHEVNEALRDQRVREAFENSGMSVRVHVDQCVAEPGTVRTGEGRFYTVFTPFKKALYRSVLERGVHPLPAPGKQGTINVSSDPVPTSVPGFVSTVPASQWPAGEHEALARLGKFISHRGAAYKRDRDFPAIEGTSTLSPYLAVGAISPRACWHAAARANDSMNTGVLDAGDPGLSCWISELAWREFYRHVLVGFPRVCKHRAFKPETERLRWSEHDEHFRAWCEGRTGVPIVDAAMRCLVRTGWLHNRLRMIVAMYLTKDLFIDWRKGERFFMQQLIDGDLASNNGGWQWSASTGTDAAPYFRVFNPVSQSEKFDADGTFIRRWVPELGAIEGEAIHDPSRLAPLHRTRLNYPEPLVDRAASLERVKRAFADLVK